MTVSRRSFTCIPSTVIFVFHNGALYLHHIQFACHDVMMRYHYVGFMCRIVGKNAIYSSQDDMLSY